MMELVEANWLFLLIALMIGIAVAWFVWLWANGVFAG